MKKSILLSVFLLIFSYFYAQDYDLIVTTKGDSLACHIDSITDSHIYFEMRHNYNWIHTMFKKDQVDKYERNVIDKKTTFFKQGTSYIDTSSKLVAKGYQHAHRLIFAPTSYSLKQGEAYYSSHYAMIHSLQYGFTDNISLDFGTTIMAFPFYAMLNASFPVSDNIAFTVGNLVLFDIWVEPGLLGNLTYGLVTIGKEEKNFNIGGGYLYFPDEGFTQKNNTLAMTISNQLKIGIRSYLLNEYYVTILNTKYWPDIEYYASMDEYLYKTLFIGGITGIRMTGKKNPRLAWQFGIAPIILIDNNKIPDLYNDPSIDNHLDDGKLMVRGAPIISFSYKFGKKDK